MGNVTATARYVQSAPQRTAIATRSRAKAAVARAAEEALLTDLPFLPEIILYFFENIVPDSCFFQMFCIARELNVAMRNFCDHNDSMTRLFVLRIPLWCHDMLSVMSTQCWLRHTSAPGYENRAITVEPRGWIAESSKVSIEALRWLEALRLKMTTVIRSIGACALIGVQVGLFDVLQEIATSRLFGLAKYAMNTPTAIIDQHVMDAVELREMFAIKGSVVYSVMIATVLPTASLQVFRRLVAQLASTDILRVLHWVCTFSKNTYACLFVCILIVANFTAHCDVFHIAHLWTHQPRCAQGARRLLFGTAAQRNRDGHEGPYPRSQRADAFWIGCRRVRLCALCGPQAWLHPRGMSLHNLYTD